MKTPADPYSGYRYPAEIISHAAWLYLRFALSLRDVEEILAARGIVVSYEAVRQWCLNFGQRYAKGGCYSPILPDRLQDLESTFLFLPIHPKFKNGFHAVRKVLQCENVAALSILAPA